MNNEEGKKCEEHVSIIQAYNRLNTKLSELTNAAIMTTRLNDKLLRVDRPNDDGCKEKEKEDRQSIPDMLNQIADGMEREIGIIQTSTEHSMNMIE